MGDSHTLMEAKMAKIRVSMTFLFPLKQKFSNLSFFDASMNSLGTFGAVFITFKFLLDFAAKKITKKMVAYFCNPLYIKKNLQTTLISVVDFIYQKIFFQFSSGKVILKVRGE